MTASYQTRLIVRDVTGKYTWDSAVLYGPKPSPPQSSKGEEEGGGRRGRKWGEGEQKERGQCVLSFLSQQV